VDIIHELKQKIRVVLGTNTIDSHYKVHINRGDYSIFQKVYASNVIGYAKPDINFYKYILDSEKIEPSECILIDDSPKNVEAANSIGINGIVFSDAQSLRRILSNKYKLLN
jgi:putative hydrolase of the HAD superfamily